MATGAHPVVRFCENFNYLQGIYREDDSERSEECASSAALTSCSFHRIAEWMMIYTSIVKSVPPKQQQAANSGCSSDQDQGDPTRREREPESQNFDKVRKNTANFDWMPNSNN